MHRTFRDSLIPIVRRCEVARLDRGGRPELVSGEEPQGAYLDNRWRPCQKAQADQVRTYLLALGEIAREIEAAGGNVPDMAELKADCAMLEIDGVLELPPETRLPALDFRECRFHAAVSFRDVAFLDYANFKRADFLDKADFANTDFLQGGSFRRCVFCKFASFFCLMGNAKRAVDFTSATFIGYADFEGAISNDFVFADMKFLDAADFS